MRIENSSYRMHLDEAEIAFQVEDET